MKSGEQHTFESDNQAVTYVLGKGHSVLATANKMLRDLYSKIPLHQIRPRWIPSETNPADEPTREGVPPCSGTRVEDLIERTFDRGFGGKAAIKTKQSLQQMMTFLKDPSMRFKDRESALNFFVPSFSLS